MRFDLLGLRENYRARRAAANKIQDIQRKIRKQGAKAHLQNNLATQERICRRAGLALLGKLGVLIVGTAAFGFTYLTRPEKIESKSDIRKELIELAKFFSERRSRMKNFNDPGNLDLLNWSVLAMENNWGSEQLKMIDGLAAEKLPKYNFVNSEIEFIILDFTYPAFILCARPQSEINPSDKSVIQLNLRYKAADLTKEEWGAMIDHELNHALLRKTDVIMEGVNSEDKVNLFQYWINYINLITLILPEGKKVEFTGLVNKYEKIVVKSGESAAKTLIDLGIMIDEILADGMIRPVTDVTRSRYRKVINHMFMQFEKMGQGGLGFKETVAALLGTTVDTKIAESKVTGDPEARLVMREITKLVFDIAPKIVSQLKYNSNTGLYELKSKPSSAPAD